MAKRVESPDQPGLGLASEYILVDTEAEIIIAFLDAKAKAFPIAEAYWEECAKLGDKPPPLGVYKYDAVFVADSS